jgi:septal ring factor EnvC (AmiA/AmiB activator)
MEPAKTRKYTGTHLLLGLAVGVLLGAMTEPVWTYFTYLALPKDKATIARQISDLQSRVGDQMNTITVQSNKITELNNDLKKSEKSLRAAKEEAEQAKTATPRRYEVVKEGARTWRLDTATGKTCLLLASDSDWNKFGMSAQSCERVQ